MQRFSDDLTFVAAPRPPGSPHWAAVQSRCAETFADLGYEVRRAQYPSGVNVVGTKPGARTDAPWVVVGAHYDHIPGCAGADDNGTGVAGVLEMARVLWQAPVDATVVFACWDEEERGLLGSLAYTRELADAGQAVAVYFNFDGIGFVNDTPGSQRVPPGMGLLFGDELRRLEAEQYRGDFIAAIADPSASPYTEMFSSHADAVGLRHAVLEVPKLVQYTPVGVELQRSDHANFWAIGAPAIMLTDTADYRSPHYHCHDAPDTLQTVDVDFAAQVVAAATGAVAQAAGAAGSPR